MPDKPCAVLVRAPSPILVFQDGIGELGAAEETKMTERLHENEARVEELTKNWTSKWRETQKIIEVNKTELMRKSNHPECPVRRAGNTLHSKLCY